MSELSNFSLFAQTLWKVGYITGLVPGIVLMALVHACPFPFCWKRDFHEGDHKVRVPIARFDPDQFSLEVSGGGQLAQQNVIPLQDRATSPPRKERKRA
jgi:hypothetical protein